jgi:SHS2 domain-containing protein
MSRDREEEPGIGGGRADEGRQAGGGSPSGGDGPVPTSWGDGPVPTSWDGPAPFSRDDPAGVSGEDGGSIPGVEALDHTADVGIRVEAEDLAGLYRRAALGALWITLGETPAQGTVTRTLQVSAETHPDLMRRWLREILFLQEVEGFAAGQVRDLELESVPGGLRLKARLRGGTSPLHPAREIKGVTWHGLRVEKGDAGWFAEIIFDV